MVLNWGTKHINYCSGRGMEDLTKSIYMVVGASRIDMDGTSKTRSAMAITLQFKS